MRRTFKAFLIVVVLLCPQTGDAQSLYPYLENIRAISGYNNDGSLRLNANITRAEAIKILVASESGFRHEDIESYRKFAHSYPYTDVEVSSWYAPYIMYAVVNSNSQEHVQGPLRPHEAITVAEAFYLLHWVMRLEKPTPFLKSALIRNIPNRWFSDAVSTAISRNLIAERLDLASPILRRQFFELVERLRVTQEYNLYTYHDSMHASLEVDRDPFGAYDTLSKEEYEEHLSKKQFAISIPTVGISDISVIHPEKTDTQKSLLAPLDKGLGHLFSYPGEGGKVMVYGHSSTWPWVKSEFAKLFATINELKEKDPIYLTRNGNLYKYAVERSETTRATDLSAYASNTGDEALILYTCWPIGQTAQRLLVHARLESVTQSNQYTSSK
jgi:LPXTG-site transpeptidase (sortase) family protein